MIINRNSFLELKRGLGWAETQVFQAGAELQVSLPFLPEYWVCKPAALRTALDWEDFMFEILSVVLLKEDSAVKAGAGEMS